MPSALHSRSLCRLGSGAFRADGTRSVPATLILPGRVGVQIDGGRVNADDIRTQRHYHVADVQPAPIRSRQRELTRVVADGRYSVPEAQPVVWTLWSRARQRHPIVFSDIDAVRAADRRLERHRSAALGNVVNALEHRGYPNIRLRPQPVPRQH